MLQTVTAPATLFDWIQIYNTSNVAAPVGGDAFVAGSAVDATGKISVLAAGTFPASAQADIIIPSYIELTYGVIHRSRG